VWKFHGFNYIDVADPAYAAYFILKQISSLSDWFWSHGFRHVTTLSDDFDNDTICTFYWSDRDGPKTYRHIESAGVLLALCEKPARGSDHRHPELSKRPIVIPTLEASSNGSFHLTMIIHFMCNNPQKLRQHHWPKLMEKYALSAEDRVELGPPPRDGVPNEITVLKTLTDVPEHEAIAHCLARAERCRFKLGAPEEDFFLAERFPGSPDFDGTFSISLTRAA
jgi:hypothetical protein